MRKYLLETIIGGIIVAMIAGLFFLALQHGERLAKLEAQFDICVDCSQQITKIGEYPFKSYKAVDVAPDGEVLLEADIDLLSEQFRWKCASFDEIVRGNKKEDLGEIIRSYRDNAELNDALGIVCVGTASAEGAPDNEENRAMDRVETLINLVDANLTSKKMLPIYGMNFGQYKGGENQSCSNATLDQRRIVLVKIIKRSERITNENLESSLQRLFLQKAVNSAYKFPIDIRNYSMFNSGKTMLVYGRRNPK